jgi:hypothetical protein
VCVCVCVYFFPSSYSIVTPLLPCKILLFLQFCQCNFSSSLHELSYGSQPLTSSPSSPRPPAPFLTFHPTTFFFSFFPSLSIFLFFLFFSKIVNFFFLPSKCPLLPSFQINPKCL